jgi:hypothetical protein
VIYMRENNKENKNSSQEDPPLMYLDIIDELEELNVVENFLEGQNIPLKRVSTRKGVKVPSSLNLSSP